MFWKTQPVNFSNVNQLLDNEDLKLTDLLSDEYLLEEIKCENKRLIEYFKGNVLEELVRTALTDIPGAYDDVKKYKYCHLSCEVLTSEDENITRSAVENEQVLLILHQFVATPDVLNPLLCSYYSRIFCLFLRKHPEVIIPWMKSAEKLADHLLNHIDSAAIGDILFRMVACTNAEADQKSIKEWLVSENISTKLIDLLSPDQDIGVQSNASHLICELIKHLREAQYQSERQSLDEGDPLLNQLVSKTVLNHLMQKLFAVDRTDSVFANGIRIFITLVQTGPATMSNAVESTLPDLEPWDPDPERVTETVILENLPKFHGVLENPPKTKSITIPCGHIETPYGNSRLQIQHLLVALLGSSSCAVHAEIKRLGTLRLILGHIFLYPWNNFLHTLCCQCVSCLLNTPCAENIAGGEPKCMPSPLLPQLFDPVDSIINTIVQAVQQRSEENHAIMQQPLPYMGHIMQMANSIVIASQESSLAEKIKDLINGLPLELRTKWDEFVSGTLTSYNKLNEPYSVTNERGGTPDLDSLAIEDHELFPLDSAQQAFTEFQTQKMSTEFPEKFAMSAADFFADEDNAIKKLAKETTGDLLKNKVDTMVAAGSIPDPEGEAAFESMCSERMRAFDDSGSEDEGDEWPTKEIEFDDGRGLGTPPVMSSEHKPSFSSDEDEEPSTSKPTKMETDNADEWADFSSAFSSPSIGAASAFDPFQSSPIKSNEKFSKSTEPWDQANASMDFTTSSSTVAEPGDNWANFDNLVPANSSNSPSSVIHPKQDDISKKS